MRAIQPRKRSIAVHLNDCVKALQFFRKMIFAQLRLYIDTRKPIAQSVRMLAEHGGRDAVFLEVACNRHHQQ
ncbi:hypothetical protein GCM10011400_70890 [Paraburkholderia caffeinilytica]|uniref:Transposase n=1 Tax=Paraburkholderia caffeinilytica TaxID=1761016 RepID=A0ABQ1NDG5_9BURK|nr:hypothetical protein GCM10011400_70890 [Paraburkholderia caffeinilytica]